MDNLIVSSNIMNSSVENIKKHFDKVRNNNEMKIAHIKELSENSLKRSNIKNRTLEQYNFSRSALTGSVFTNVTLIDCNFDSAVAEFCDFYNCEFIQKTKCNTMLRFNFSNSNFMDCKFYGVGLYTSSLTNALFKNVEFNNCNIELSSFENSVFDNVIFKNMELRNLNIEFSEFKNIECQNVVFPLSQISYVFGALEYLLNTSNKTVWITSHSSQNQRMSINQFRELLPDLINYYIYLEEYFPLANLYIATGRYQEAINTIYKGIDKAAKEKDFRMLKFFCKLIVNNGWSGKNDRISMYKYICNIDKKTEMTIAELHNYYLHFGDFRKILLNNEETMPTLYYTINSNIEENDFIKLSSTIEIIDGLIEQFCDNETTHYIEIRHESPFTFLIVIAASLSVLKLVCECIDKVCSTITKVQEVHINQQEIKLNDAELQKITEEQKKLKTSGIILSGSSYIKNKN